MTPRFRAKIIDGKCILEKPDLYRGYISTIKDGSFVSITIKKWKKKRSDLQNRYYWGVVIPILSEFCGYESDEMHEALKWKFLRVPASLDRTLETVSSTAMLSTTEFIEYIDAIKRWAAIEYHVVIPDPDEVEL